MAVACNWARASQGTTQTIVQHCYHSHCFSSPKFNFRKTTLYNSVLSRQKHHSRSQGMSQTTGVCGEVKYLNFDPHDWLHHRSSLSCSWSIVSSLFGSVNEIMAVHEDAWDIVEFPLIFMAKKINEFPQNEIHWAFSPIFSILLKVCKRLLFSIPFNSKFNHKIDPVGHSSHNSQPFMPQICNFTDPSTCCPEQYAKRGWIQSRLEYSAGWLQWGATRDTSSIQRRDKYALFD